MIGPTTNRASSAPASLGLALLGAIALGAVALFLGACGDGGSSRGGAPPWASGGGRPPAVVSAAPVEQGAFAVRQEFVGTLDAEVSADIYARTAGPLTAVYANTGDRVRAGEVLAQIDPADARQALDEARAALRIAEATVVQREADLEIAENNDRRSNTLYDQNLVSEQERDATEATRIGAEAQLELARAQVAQARTRVTAAELALDRTRVVAPFTGSVGTRYLDLGDLATTNRPVFSLVDLTSIVTTIPLTERDAARIATGQEAMVNVSAFPERSFTGRVARIASIFDPETNTTQAEVTVDNPEGVLKPGMLATVAVAYRTEPTALLVPEAALVESERGETWVYVAETAPEPAPAAGGGGGDDGSGTGARGGPGGGSGPSLVARRVPVRVLGTGPDGRTAVEPVDGPLEAGAQVVTLGQDQLSDGAPVTVSDGTPASSRGERPDGRQRV